MTGAEPDGFQGPTRGGWCPGTGREEGCRDVNWGRQLGLENSAERVPRELERGPSKRRERKVTGYGERKGKGCLGGGLGKRKGQEA